MLRRFAKEFLDDPDLGLSPAPGTQPRDCATPLLQRLRKLERRSMKMSILGHNTETQAMAYTRQANRKVTAASAMAKRDGTNDDKQ